MEKDYTNLYEKLKREISTAMDENLFDNHIKSNIKNYLSKNECLFSYKKEFNLFLRTFNSQNNTRILSTLCQKVGFNFDEGTPVFKNCTLSELGKWEWRGISKDKKIVLRKFTKNYFKDKEYESILGAGITEQHISGSNSNKVSFETKISKRLLKALDYSSYHYNSLKSYEAEVEREIKKYSEVFEYKLLDQIFTTESTSEIVDLVKDKKVWYLPKRNGVYNWSSIIPQNEDKVCYLAIYSEKNNNVHKIRIGMETVYEIYRCIRERAKKVIDLIIQQRSEALGPLQPFEILNRIQALIVERHQNRRKITEIITEQSKMSLDEIKNFVKTFGFLEDFGMFGILKEKDYLETQNVFGYMANKLFEYNFDEKLFKEDKQIKRLQYVASMQNKKYGTQLNALTDVVCFDIDNLGGNNGIDSFKFLVERFKLVPENFVFAEYSAIGSGGLHVYVKIPEKVEINKYRSLFEHRLNEEGNKKIEVRGSTQNTVMPLSIDYFPVDIDSFFETGILRPIQKKDWGKFIRKVFKGKEVGNQNLFDDLTFVEKTISEEIIEESSSWKKVDRQGVHNFKEGKAVLRKPVLPLRKGQSNKQIFWLADWYRNVENKTFEEFFTDIQKSKNSEGADANIYNEPCFTTKNRFKPVWDKVEGSTYYNSFCADGDYIRKNPKKFISNFNRWEPSTYYTLDKIGLGLSQKFCKNLSKYKPILAKRSYISKVARIVCSCFTACFYSKALWEVINPSYIVAKVRFDEIANLRGIPLSIKYLTSFMEYVCDEIEHNTYKEISKYVDQKVIEEVKGSISEIRKMLKSDVNIWRNVLVETFDLKYTEYEGKNYNNGICKCVDLKNDYEVRKHLRNLIIQNVRDKNVDLISLKNINLNKDRDEVNINKSFQVCQDRKYMTKLFAEGKRVTKEVKMGINTVKTSAKKLESESTRISYTNEVEDLISNDNNEFDTCFSVFARIKVVLKFIQDKFVEIKDTIVDSLNESLLPRIIESGPPA